MKVLEIIGTSKPIVPSNGYYEPGSYLEEAVEVIDPNSPEYDDVFTSHQYINVGGDRCIHGDINPETNTRQRYPGTRCEITDHTIKKYGKLHNIENTIFLCETF